MKPLFAQGPARGSPKCKSQAGRNDGDQHAKTKAQNKKVEKHSHGKSFLRRIR
jgi:hypothetical protein